MISNKIASSLSAVKSLPRVRYVKTSYKGLKSLYKEISTELETNDSNIVEPTEG